ALAHHDVEGGDAVRGDEQDAVFAKGVDVTHLALVQLRQVEVGREHRRWWHHASPRRRNVASVCVRKARGSKMASSFSVGSRVDASGSASRRPRYGTSSRQARIEFRFTMVYASSRCIPVSIRALSTFEE